LRVHGNIIPSTIVRLGGIERVNVDIKKTEIGGKKLW
jgi:hypothetical protein